jgi:hypothetical protein
MSPILTQTTGPDGKTGLHVDLAIFEAPMKEALRRATVFLGYAFHTSQVAPLKSVRLNGPIILDVGVPDSFPPADRKRYQTEFTQWAIGQGLIEIDQSYRYVVSALDTLTDIESFLRGQSLIGHRKPNLANTWAVHEQFYAKLGQQSNEHQDESGYLRCLGNARNCLAHDGGTVTRRRMVDGRSTMAVRWPGRDMLKVDQNGSSSVLPLDRSFRVLEEDIGSQLSVVEVIREHDYAEGDRIRLSQTDLSEIIFFYQILAMKIGSEMHRIVGEKMAETRP